MARLKKLTLTNFRNYPRLVWEPESSLVVLTGENGSGKTNLLEALSLLTAGRGLRRAPIAQLGYNQSVEWGISAQFHLGNEYVDLATGIVPGGEVARRVHLFNGRILPKKESLEDTLAAVWLTPQMDRLFSDNASGRRRFLDRLIMAISPNHARELTAYDRAMAQRNRLLQTRFTENSWLAGLEASMARHAVAIAAARQDLVQQLCLSASEATSGFPATRGELDCIIGNKIAQNAALVVEDWLKERLHANRQEDRERGRATLGTHRADFTLSDYATGLPASTASTGQQKAMLIGIILAHADLVKEYRGAPPILLFDEPLVHLDQAKRTALLARLKTFQTTAILTGTDSGLFEDLHGAVQFSTLKNGQFLSV